MKKHLKYCVLILSFISMFNVFASDKIIDFSATEIIGYKQLTTIYIELEVNKTRDLHIAIQNMDGWKTIKKTMKRIKTSGKYHFDVPMDDLSVGKYRIDAYMTPRGKRWNQRLNEVKRIEFEVVNQEIYVKKIAFGNQDQIKLVDWPENIIGAQEATLSIKYNISQPRDLHIKLQDSSNWKEYGALKFPLSEPGEFTLQLSHLTEDFPQGKYVWIVFLTPLDETKEISKKYGKHFTLANETKK